jgi:hypothetical protein
MLRMVIKFALLRARPPSYLADFGESVTGERHIYRAAAGEYESEYDSITRREAEAVFSEARAPRGGAQALNYKTKTLGPQKKSQVSRSTSTDGESSSLRSTSSTPP